MSAEIQEFSAYSLTLNRVQSVRVLSRVYDEHAYVETLESKERFWMPSSELIPVNPAPTPKKKRYP